MSVSSCLSVHPGNTEQRISGNLARAHNQPMAGYGRTPGFKKYWYNTSTQNKYHQHIKSMISSLTI